MLSNELSLRCLEERKVYRMATHRKRTWNRKCNTTEENVKVEETPFCCFRKMSTARYFKIEDDLAKGGALDPLISTAPLTYLELVGGAVGPLGLFYDSPAENTATAVEYKADFEGAEDYRDNFFELKPKIETLLNKDSGSVLESSSASVCDVVKLKLSKFELKMFSGDPKEYFSKIHDSKELTAIDKFLYFYTNVGRDSPPIRLLLGADILGSILTGRIEVLSSGVSEVEILLGWTILGLGKKREVVNLVTLSLKNMDVPKMWDLEVLGITDPIEKKNESLLEEETLAHFKETVRICEDQRFEVALPWLAGHHALYDKYDAAESRLRTATKCLINENYFEAYHNVFKQW
ncbi:DUF1758 domain-containing protein [Trichonephila inaurata madagascariensis]|uniref:DUF1758 domain-containing protein n=1 Tax=Trichonephila inaurata madagascariensis TaxID=2747483 RepID=A0A8X7CMB6_9ARAC|nr:DUF1758 domain-containing protein [Trichonephila inaurata madagascariensis]